MYVIYTMDVYDLMYVSTSIYTHNHTIYVHDHSYIMYVYIHTYMYTHTGCIIMYVLVNSTY